MENRLDELIVEKLNLPGKPLEIGDWRHLLQRIKNPYGFADNLDMRDTWPL